MKISQYFSRIDIVDDEDHRYILTDDAPEWLQEAINEAHAGASHDDHIYELAHSFALDYDNGNISNRDADDSFGEWADSQVDLGDRDLYLFAADNYHARWYDDEQAKESVGADAGPLDHIRMVQYIIAQVVASALWEAIKEAEDDDSDVFDEEATYVLKKDDLKS